MMNLKQMAENKVSEILFKRKEKERQELFEKELKKLKKDEEKKQRIEEDFVKERHELLQLERIRKQDPGTAILRCYACGRILPNLKAYIKRSLTTKPPEIRIWGSCPKCKRVVKHEKNQKLSHVITCATLPVTLVSGEVFELEKHFIRGEHNG